MKETKKCPYCGETILATAKKCKNCGEWLYDQNEMKLQKEKEDIQVQAVKTNVKPHSFFEYYFVDVFIRNYANFKGSTSRKQFWMSFLCYYILMTVLICYELFFLNYVFGFESQFILYQIASIALAIPGCALGVRRLHDIGKSGWWILISIAPFVGPIWLLVLFCKKGITICEPVKHTIKDYIVWGLIPLLFILTVAIIFILDDSGAPATY